jgi:GntP family gluconate:H+ symporter
LPFHPVYLALAIGCGSKPFPWMNDSGFWVINRMSGMTIRESIRSVSILMTVMAISGLFMTIFLAWVFPKAF